MTLSSSPATTGLDLAQLRRAIHDGDADAMLALYADDAEIVVYDRDNPPSEPSTIRGRARIGDMLNDVFGRDMTHEITRAVTDGEHAAWTVACRYAEGVRVAAHSMADVRDGRIVHEEMIQVWDA